MVKQNQSEKVVQNILGEKPKNYNWLFKDSDNDGVVNYNDCEPNNPNKQGVVEKFSNLVQGKGWTEDKEQSQQQSQQQQPASQPQPQEKQQSFKEFKKDVRQQEAYEQKEQKVAKKELGPVQHAVYKGYDVLRDLGQATVRGTKEMSQYSDKSNVYDYSESAGYKEAQRQAKQGGVTGAVGKTAKFGINVGSGAIRAVPGGAPTKEYTKERLQERPGMLGGQIIGEAGKYSAMGYAAGGVGRAAGGVRAASGAGKVAKTGAGATRLAARGTQAGLEQKRIADVTGAGVEATEEYTRPNYDFNQKMLERSQQKARQQAIQEEDSFLRKLGSGVSTFAVDKSKYKENLREIGEKKGLSEEKLNKFVEAGVRRRKFTGAKEAGQLVGIERASEKVGRQALASGGKIAGKKMPWKVAKKGAATLGPVGAAEGAVGYGTQQKTRGQKASAKELVMAGALGGASAGLIGGTVAGSQASKVTPTTKFGKYRQKAAKGLELGAYALDPYEYPGDVLETGIRRGKLRTFGGTDVAPTAKAGKVPEFYGQKTVYGKGGKVITPSVSTPSQTQTQAPTQTKTKTPTQTQTQTKTQTQAPTQTQTQTETTTTTSVPTQTQTNVPTITPDKGGFIVGGPRPSRKKRQFNRSVFGKQYVHKVKDFAGSTSKSKKQSGMTKRKPNMQQQSMPNMQRQSKSRNNAKLQNYSAQQRPMNQTNKQFQQYKNKAEKNDGQKRIVNLLGAKANNLDKLMEKNKYKNGK